MRKQIQVLYLGVALFMASSVFGQMGRIELLTRSEAVTPRRGVDSSASNPEVSANGQFVLFTSAAGNLDPARPSGNADNLFLIERATGAKTLISVGLNGDRANDTILGFQFSINNRRILFETAASNLVANDTNNAVDVFIRDLDLQQTILVTVNTNGGPARRGGFDASMSGDGTRVSFTSRSADFTSNDTNIVQDVYLRDLTAGTTELVSVSANGFSVESFAQNSTISTDGARVLFESWADLLNGGASPVGDFYYLFDLGTHALRLVASDVSQVIGPKLSADGKSIPYAVSSGRTNWLYRFDVLTGTTAMIASNRLFGPFQVHSVSADGGVFVYSQSAELSLWKSDEGALRFPRNIHGQLALIYQFESPPEVSADGRVVAFVAESPDLVDNLPLGAPHAYVYEVEGGKLMRISPNNDARGFMAGPPKNPVINADGSVVVVTAISDEVDAAAEGNLFAWERATERATLLTENSPDGFENSALFGSSISERLCMSDDAQRIVFASLTPANDKTDTNRTWDIFVIDRTTGVKTLVSVAVDGQKAASGPSIKPVLSGDGQMVAFESYATNLTATAPSVWPRHFYVRNLRTGVTTLLKSSAGQSVKPTAYSFSRDGRFLAFASETGFLDTTYANSRGVFVFDTTTGKISLVSYNSAKTAAALGTTSSPEISPDGKYIAFQSLARDLGGGVPATGSYGLFLRNLETGAIKMISPRVFSFSTIKFQMEFNPESSRLLFRDRPLVPTDGGSFNIYDLASGTLTNICTNCISAAVSENLRWGAFFTRFAGTSGPGAYYLKDLVGGDAVKIADVTQFLSNVREVKLGVTEDGNVFFETKQPNLLPGDTNTRQDLYIFDRAKSELRLLSAAPSGAAGNSSSHRPILSPDKTFVLFKSFASDLVPNDFNNAPDLFLAYLPFPDTDNDRLDDRWETANFESLGLDGSADSDGDGIWDRAEFAAGTNPRLASSVLQITGLAPISSEIVQIRWAAIPGRAYRLQTNGNLSAPWQDFGQPMIAATTMGVVGIPPVAGNQFARIVLAE